MGRKKIVIGAAVIIGASVIVGFGAKRFSQGKETAQGNHSPVEGVAHDKHESDGDGHDHGESETEGHNGAEGTISLTTDQVKAAGIEVTIAKSGSIGKEIAFPAEVKLNADNVAHIFPRFAGVVRQVRKAIGDSVKKGDLLAVIESNESLTNYEIRSLIDGTIIERHVTLGEMIREDAECFIVADLSTIWIDINVYPKDLALVKHGSTVRVNASSIEATAEGKISYVGPVVSEHTRTALARVVLPNPENIWRPGIFVTARVITHAVEVPLVIARDALQTIEGKPSVFVEIESGTFRSQPVQLGRKSDKVVEVISGLNVGDKYVFSGTFILKAELGKSEASHSHDH